MSRLRIVERTGSTNADILADGAAEEGDWLIALEQEAGRGRQGRRWVSAKGNFAGSALVVLRPSDPQPQTLSFVAGLALVEALDAAPPAQPLILKWPNDVLLFGKKLAGILLERSGDRIAIGFGVNLATAPKLADRPTVALGGALSPEAFAPLLAGSFASLLEIWRTTQTSAVLQAWEKRAHWPGARLTVHVAKNERITGRFAGLAPDGALQLMLDNGAIEVVRAGDVEL